MNYAVQSKRISIYWALFYRFARLPKLGRNLFKVFYQSRQQKNKEKINKIKTYNISTIIFGTKISMYNNIFLKTYEYSLGI